MLVCRGRLDRCVVAGLGPVCVWPMWTAPWCLHWRRDHLYSSSEDKTIRVWNIHSGECVHRIEADENPISSLAHSGVLLFSGSLKTIKVRAG